MRFLCPESHKPHVRPYSSTWWRLLGLWFVSNEAVLWSYGLQQLVRWCVGTQVSKDHAASIIRVETETRVVLERWYMPTGLHSAVTRNFRSFVSRCAKSVLHVRSTWPRLRSLYMWTLNRNVYVHLRGHHVVNWSLVFHTLPPVIHVVTTCKSYIEPQCSAMHTT
jgi:hypothetical protein